MFSMKMKSFVIDTDKTEELNPKLVAARQSESELVQKKDSMALSEILEISEIMSDDSKSAIS